LSRATVGQLQDLREKYVCTGLAEWHCMKTRILLAGLPLSLLYCAAAAAAPAPPCVPASVVPRATSIPANLPGFGYDALTATSTDVHLLDTTGGGVELPMTVGTVQDGLLKLTPASPLVAGKSYSLNFNAFCNYGPTPQGAIAFTATAAAPFPTTIGTLASGFAVSTKDFGTTQFTITGSYNLAAEMMPWAGVYDMFIVLDGKRVATKATVNGTRLDLTATGWCDAATAATKNHSINLRGKLPFVPVVDSAITPTTFDCPAPNVTAPAGTNPNVPTKSGPPSNPGSPNPGSPNPVGSGNVANTGGTSSCSVGSPGAASSFPFALAAIGLAIVFRRRRAA
jgi:MYXO-CTERM domain-containing protein